MERDIRDILTGFEHGMLNKEEATEQFLNLHIVSNRTFNTLESIDKDTKVLIERVSQDNYVMNEQDNREMKMRIDALKSVLYDC